MLLMYMIYTSINLPPVKHPNKLAIQLNLAIVVIPCSTHLLIVDNFSKNRCNPGQTLETKPLLCGHFIPDSSL